MKTSTLLLVPSLLSLVSAAGVHVPVSGYIDSSNSAELEKALDFKYDFIVAGGGTAGLAVATRLSEKDFTVLVLEAGANEANNTDVNIPLLATSAFLTEVDWAYATDPQEHADGRSVYWPRGKGLGGSSMINFMAWTRGLASDFNYWNHKSIKGWSFKDLVPFYLRAEGWNSTSENNLGVVPSRDPRQHGKNGPVKTSISSYIWPNYEAFFTAAKSIGIPVPRDLNSGIERGLEFGLATVDRTTQTRSHSGAAYLAPAVADGRKNLAVITSALVDKLKLSKGKGGVSAKGVTFLSSSNATHTASVSSKGEVILSAGSLATPGILERSGIGHPNVLKPLDIDVVVPLNGVGESLQDHPAAVNVYKVKPNHPTFESVTENATFYGESLEAYVQHTGPLTELITAIAYLSPSQYMTHAEIAKAKKVAAKNIPGIPAYAHRNELDRVLHDDSNLEYVAINGYFGNSTGDAGTNYFSIAACLQHSFARGYVHIKSKDPRVYPSINPNYLSHPADIEYLRGALKFSRKLAAEPAMAAILDGETEPGVHVKTDDELDAYIRSVVRTEYHPAGTAALRDPSENGVVDNKLKVYGTKNIRVIDASIYPIHVTGHPQAALYALSEKAASIFAA